MRALQLPLVLLISSSFPLLLHIRSSLVLDRVDPSVQPRVNPFPSALALSSSTSWSFGRSLIPFIVSLPSQSSCYLGVDEYAQISTHAQMFSILKELIVSQLTSPKRLLSTLAVSICLSTKFSMIKAALPNHYEQNALEAIILAQVLHQPSAYLNRMASLSVTYNQIDLKNKTGLPERLGLRVTNQDRSIQPKHHKYQLL